MQKLEPIIRDRVVLTEREFSLLAVAVCEMERLGLDPYGFEYLVQIVLRLDWSNTWGSKIGANGTTALRVSQ